MIVEILGSELPGLRCGPAPDGSFYENIHVGLARRTETVDLVPGDGDSARWVFEVTVHDRNDGIDITGPFVHGKRGDRAFGLRWDVPADDGSFAVFRAAKLRFSDVDTATLREAIETGGRLLGSLGLTDEHGWPRCAHVRPPDVRWSARSPEGR
ncbi:MAG TPA: DUF5990 family protein [Actinomycetota bacterium]|jgi:hypothetical protein